MKNILVLVFLIFLISCKNEKQVKGEAVVPQMETFTPSKLLQKFAYNSKDNPIISVHRGGKGVTYYPENCLETLKYVNDSIDAIYEIDVAKTKDNVLILMHDNTLSRTSTGNGSIADFTFRELQQFNLVDDFGNETNFKIPLFNDVLVWARDNDVVLTIDIKRSIDVEQVVELIRATKAQDISIIITYDLKQAERANALAPELLLSVSARNDEEFNWLLHSGIPTENMIAFTGTRLSSKALYAKIHNYGIKTILGTLGNLDKRAASRGDSLYLSWVSKGIDVIATDRPFAVANSIHKKIKSN